MRRPSVLYVLEFSIMMSQHEDAHSSRPLRAVRAGYCKCQGGHNLAEAVTAYRRLVFPSAPSIRDQAIAKAKPDVLESVFDSPSDAIVEICGIEKKSSASIAR